MSTEGVVPRIEDVPNAARMYDYELGGSHNTARDRTAASEIRATAPHAPYIAQANRAFLGRAVRYLAGEHGIDQFLDLGSGIPTVGNVHEIAQRHDPAARVVYVDNDSVAVAHTRRILQEAPHAVIVDGDLRAPNEILRSAAVRRMLDFHRPIGVLLVAALHYVAPEDDPSAVLRAYTAALPTGSWLVCSQLTSDGWYEAQRINEFISSSVTPVTPRSHETITRLVSSAGWRFGAPGLVRPPEWHPDPGVPSRYPAVRSGSWAGVATRA